MQTNVRGARVTIIIGVLFDANRIDFLIRRDNLHPDRSCLTMAGRSIEGTAMNEPHPKNPLHGVTLAMMLDRLVETYGWEELSQRVPVRCFMFDPTVKSSLQFLRRTPWARTRVEKLYLELLNCDLNR